MEALTDLYLEYVNDYLTLEKFAEHKGISEELASLIIKEGRINHELNTVGYDGLSTANQQYFENKMLK